MRGPFESEISKGWKVLKIHDFVVSGELPKDLALLTYVKVIRCFLDEFPR